MNTTKLKPQALPLALMFAILPNDKVWGQQTAPTLTAAVLAQTAQLKEIHKTRRKIQEQMVAAEVAVTLAFECVHRVEERMLDYLANAQGAVQNLYQIKRGAETVAKEISWIATSSTTAQALSKRLRKNA